MEREEITDVVFRMWVREGNQVIALFPGHAGDVGKPWTCSSYMHVGQHGSADYTGIMRATRAATEAEYASLKRELESAPYHYVLNVVRRETPTHRRERERQLARA